MEVNYAGAAYAYTTADVLFDPVLEIGDATLELNTIAAKYLRTFEVFDRSARVELTVPYQDAFWEGLLQGQPTSREREGFADPSARVAVSLIGGPPLRGDAFRAYRAEHPAETIVGAGLTVQAPLGEYFEDKLLNLGENRFTLRPELGVEQRHGNWLADVMGTASFFTDNEEFFNGRTREQDPVFVVQGHLSYTFRPGLWVGCGAGYGFGGESTVDGLPKDDRKGNLVLGVSAGVPVNRAVGFKFAYVNGRTRESTGLNSDTFAVGVSVLW